MWKVLRNTWGIKLRYDCGDQGDYTEERCEELGKLNQTQSYSPLGVYTEVLKNRLSTIHVPHSYGFAIILLTLLVKAAKFPLTKKQVESTMVMQSLQPQIKAIQQHNAGDQDVCILLLHFQYGLGFMEPFKCG